MASTSGSVHSTSGRISSAQTVHGLWYRHWLPQGAGRRSAPQFTKVTRWRLSNACHREGLAARNLDTHWTVETLFALDTEILLCSTRDMLSFILHKQHCHILSNNYVIQLDLCFPIELGCCLFFLIKSIATMKILPWCVQHNLSVFSFVLNRENNSSMINDNTWEDIFTFGWSCV